MSQVASRAKVSRATVSHVLSGGADRFRISAQTQQRVLNIAEELGYHRNMLARAMVTGKSRILGIIMSSDLQDNISEILFGALDAANQRDYMLKVMHFPAGEVDAATVTRCLEWRLAGAMVITVSDESRRHLCEEFERIQLPLAQIDGGVDSDWGVIVGSDEVQGISQIISHLTALGHRQIAYVGGDPGELSLYRERCFRSAIAEAGLALPEHWVQTTSWFGCDVIAAGARAILHDERPTAIVCSSDAIALIVIREAGKLGLRVPNDLSVTGYANESLGPFTDPPLTTVYQPYQAMGHAAAMHLIQCAEDETKDSRIGPNPDVLLPTELIVRGSTAPPCEREVAL